MNKRFIQPLLGLAIALPLGVASTSILAQDQSKCDFSKSIGSCQAATAPRAGGGVFIFTDSLNCASVDYQADGRKRRVFVTEGRGEDVTAKKDISVIKCDLFAAIQAPKPVSAPQQLTASGMTPSGWKQPDGSIQGGYGNIPTLAAVIPSSKLTTNPSPVPAQPVPAPIQQNANSSSHKQLEGTWCDEIGQPKLVVMGSGINMMHKVGKEIPAPFLNRLADGMTYSTKRLFTTYSGKIGMDVNGQELVWDDRVSPGISKVHYLRSCS